MGGIDWFCGESNSIEWRKLRKNGNVNGWIIFEMSLWFRARANLTNRKLLWIVALRQWVRRVPFATANWMSLQNNWASSCSSDKCLKVHLPQRHLAGCTSSMQRTNILQSKPQRSSNFWPPGSMMSHCPTGKRWENAMDNFPSNSWKCNYLNSPRRQLVHRWCSEHRLWPLT